MSQPDASPGDVMTVTWRSVVATGAMALVVAATLGLASGWWTITAVAVAVLAGATSYAVAVYLLWRCCGEPAGAERILIEFLTEAWHRPRAEGSMR